jgi:hypothetical protein
MPHNFAVFRQKASNNTSLNAALKLPQEQYAERPICASL